VTGASTANFYYDADGAQVKTVVNGVTTYYVGNHYEVKNSVVTKYYFAGATRLAVRTNGMLSYLLGDHIGSSSVTTDANGVKTASALYKAFGETRFSAGNLGTDYKFTGQREEASLGIYYFNARWMDPSLGRFTSPDSIVPTSTQGTQAWDRYAFVNNNPVRYNDPTGHVADDSSSEQTDPTTTESDEVPPEWYKWLEEKVQWIGRSWPDSWFTEDGKRVLTVDAPHTGAQYWHLNTDIDVLQDSVNHTDIQPIAKKVAETVGAVQTTYYMAKEAVKAAGQEVATAATSAWGAISSFASGEIFFFPPMPAGIFQLPGQTYSG
jgi:RHS repeat-associated protein